MIQEIKDMLKPDLDKQISVTEANIDRLKTDRSEAQKAVERYAAKAVAANTAGDKVAAEQASRAKQSAQDSVNLNSDSIANEEAKRATLIAARDKIADTKTRHQTGDEFEKWLREDGEIDRALFALFKRKEESLNWILPVVPDALGSRNLYATLRAQCPLESTLIQKITAHQATAVMNGTAPATIKRADAPVAKSVETAPITVQLFATRSVKWKNAAGVQIVGQQFTDVALTPSAAKRALAARACVQMNDPIWAKHRNTRGGHGEPGHALDLDVEPAQTPQVQPIMQSSPFTVVDRGGPVQMKVAR
jgi:hypothetical protein